MRLVSQQGSARTIDWAMFVTLSLCTIFWEIENFLEPRVYESKSNLQSTCFDPDHICLSMITSLLWRHHREWSDSVLSVIIQLVQLAVHFSCWSQLFEVTKPRQFSTREKCWKNQVRLLLAVCPGMQHTKPIRAKNKNKRRNRFSVIDSPIY